MSGECLLAGGGAIKRGSGERTQVGHVMARLMRERHVVNNAQRKKLGVGTSKSIRRGICKRGQEVRERHACKRAEEIGTRVSI